MNLYILHKAVLATLLGNLPPLPLCSCYPMCIFCIFHGPFGGNFYGIGIGRNKGWGEVKQIQIRILVPLLSSSVWPVLVSFEVFIFLTMCLCTPVFVRVCTCECSTQGGQKRAEIFACTCELPGVGSANRTQVLYKNSTWFFFFS